MSRDADGANGLARHLVSLTFAVGLILLSAPVFLAPILLSQPQLELTAHPQFHLLVDKLFDLIGKVGDACVIAAVLGIVVDQGLKTKLIQEVVQAASPKLIGRHLPDPIRDALLNYFQVDFIRPDWEIEYEITLLDGFPDFVCFATRIQGAVLNCGPGDIDFTFAGSVDPSSNYPGLGKSQLTRVRMISETGGTIFDENPPNNLSHLQSDGTIIFKKTHLVPRGARYKTVLESLEYRPASFALPLFTGTSVVKSVLRIRYPKDILDISVSTGTSQNLQGEPTIWGQEWNIHTPLLPGQCILTTWNPKTNAVPVETGGSKGN